LALLLLPLALAKLLLYLAGASPCVLTLWSRMVWRQTLGSTDCGLVCC
jgi:hypothetical protein